MGRQMIHMANDDVMVLGYDRPFDTWFAYLHRAGSKYEADIVIGYHPSEQDLAKAENPNVVIGPYPVNDPKVLCEELIPKYFGGDDPERQKLYEPLEDQPDCWFCKKPPWESSSDCPQHPYNRLYDS